MPARIVDLEVIDLQCQRRRGSGCELRLVGEMRYFARETAVSGADFTTGAAGGEVGKDGADLAVLQDLARFDADAGLVGAGGDLEDVERVRAEFEDVVFDADLVEVEDIGPDLREGLFLRRAGGDVIGSVSGGSPVGDWKSAAIDLGVGGEREGWQCDEGSGGPCSPAASRAGVCGGQPGGGVLPLLGIR